MKDNSFDPKTIAVKAGDSVMFDAVNVGKSRTTCASPPSTGNYDAQPGVVTNPEIINAGKSGMIEWKVPTQTGTYKFRCDIHPTEMTGTITVQ